MFGDKAALAPEIKGSRPSIVMPRCRAKPAFPSSLFAMEANCSAVVMRRRASLSRQSELNACTSFRCACQVSGISFLLFELASGSVEDKARAGFLGNREPMPHFPWFHGDSVLCE